MKKIIFAIIILSLLSSCKKDTSSLNHSETIYVRVQETANDGTIISTTNYVSVKIQ